MWTPDEFKRLVGGAVVTATVFALVSGITSDARAASSPRTPSPPPPPVPPSPDAPTVAAAATAAALPLHGTAVVPGGYLMQAYRDGHHAIDIGAREGTPVYAALDGVIRGVWPNGRLAGGGNTVALSHEGRQDGTVYMHFQTIRPGLRVGQRVMRGELLGTVGRTDSSADNGLFNESPAHVHFVVMAPLASPGDVARFNAEGTFPPRVEPVAWARAAGVVLGTGRGLR